jgi:hypothetical protein
MERPSSSDLEQCVANKKINKKINKIKKNGCVAIGADL